MTIKLQWRRAITSLALLCPSAARTEVRSSRFAREKGARFAREERPLASLVRSGARFACGGGGARFARTERRRALASLVKRGARFARGGGDARFARSDEAKAPLKRNGDR